MFLDGFSPLVCGLLGYASIILCDLNNTSHNNDRMQSLYTVGGGLLGLAFFNAIVTDTSAGSSLPAAVRIPSFSCMSRFSPAGASIGRRTRRSLPPSAGGSGSW